jgi:hypothetical protein
MQVREAGAKGRVKVDDVQITVVKTPPVILNAVKDLKKLVMDAVERHGI